MGDTVLDYYLLFWIFIIGICLGSFFNVVILRSLCGESIVFPPSKCPKCGLKLKPWHNIPILSYIFLKGKCAFCKEKISPQYPIIEFITGLLFALTYIKFGISHIVLFIFFCISCLIIMTTTDIKEKIVDCNYAIAMIVVGLIYAFIAGGLSCLKDAVIGGILGFVVIELIALVGHLFKKGRAMGEADSYIAAALGTAVGYSDIIHILMYSLIASMVFILPTFCHERYKEKDALTILFLALFFMSISFTIYFQRAIWTLILLAFIGIALTFLIIKSMNNKKVVTSLPFVPALSAGFLYYIFFVL